MDLNYARDRRTVTSDRSGGAVLAGRIGVYDRVEASIALPILLGIRTFEMGLNSLTDHEKSGLGDVSVQLNVRGWGERALWPGGIFTLAGVAPTGPSPYLKPIQGLNSAQVPVDITQVISPRGVWAVRGGPSITSRAFIVERTACRPDGVTLEARQAALYEGQPAVTEIRLTETRPGPQDPAPFRLPEGVRLVEPPPRRQAGFTRPPPSGVSAGFQRAWTAGKGVPLSQRTGPPPG